MSAPPPSHRQTASVEGEFKAALKTLDASAAARLRKYRELVVKSGVRRREDLGQRGAREIEGIEQYQGQEYPYGGYQQGGRGQQQSQQQQQQQQGRVRCHMQRHNLPPAQIPSSRPIATAPIVTTTTKAARSWDYVSLGLPPSEQSPQTAHNAPSLHPTTTSTSNPQSSPPSNPPRKKAEHGLTFHKEWHYSHSTKTWIRQPQILTAYQPEEWNERFVVRNQVMRRAKRDGLVYFIPVGPRGEILSGVEHYSNVRHDGRRGVVHGHERERLGGRDHYRKFNQREPIVDEAGLSFVRWRDILPPPNLPPASNKATATLRSTTTTTTTTTTENTTSNRNSQHRLTSRSESTNTPDPAVITSPPPRQENRKRKPVHHDRTNRVKQKRQKLIIPASPPLTRGMKRKREGDIQTSVKQMGPLGSGKVEAVGKAEDAAEQDMVHFFHLPHCASR